MRYLLFGGLNYYPQGGFNDYLGASENLDSAKKMIKVLARSTHGEKNDLWAHIVDTEPKSIVASRIVASFTNQLTPHKIDGYTGEYEFVESKLCNHRYKIDPVTNKSYCTFCGESGESCTV